MTAYNGRYRCEGGQRRPVQIVRTSGGTYGQCPGCAKYFRLYPNGRVVMHKRASRRQEARG